ETELDQWKNIKIELNRKITSIPKDELRKLEKVIQETARVFNVFDLAISKYRNDRRKDVENKATEIFQRIRSKEYFSKLPINDTYGLSIITEHGVLLNKAELRSAGEEQVLAFALIGGLNNCSEIEAPVFMDTPFGRLDTKHGTRVLGELPNLSEEVILLVTDRELRKGDEIVLSGKIKTDLTVFHKNQEEGSFVQKTRVEA
ncbi:MAG: hypothetical protein GYA51_00160, partial [Candidatus Methanofastidiosa archaeon]|nr:hypothetical protein [Candidatus Methanofastidiosa archaeon]